MIWTKQQILHLLRMFMPLPQASAQTFSWFGNSSADCASFSLSIKTWANMMKAFFYLSILCGFVDYQKIIKLPIVLEIYITSDVIRSNLVLTVLTLYRSSLQTFLNARKSLSGHAKKTILLRKCWRQTNFIWFENLGKTLNTDVKFYFKI